MIGTSTRPQMERFDITLESTHSINLGDLNADGFEKLLAACIDRPFTWRQEDDGCICVTFRHEAADRDRAYGASERLANELGIGIWTVSVAPVDAVE
jgi:hypothetical protein